MDDDSHVVDKGWDALPDYATSGETDDAVTLSISTTPGEWLVNTMDSVVVPMSMADVVDALRAHKLTERSLVWRAGMQEWAPIDKVPPLKLAARLPPTMAASPPSASSAAPPPSAASQRRPTSKTAPPRPTPAPQGQLSGRSPLPFGPRNPTAASRPSQAKASSPPPSAPPPLSEEPEVLAVYSRPAATISFDLSPSEPARVPPPVPAQAPPPQTLAPTTSDTRSVPRSAAPPPFSADLSVVAASQFRAVQRSSKRLVWVSSLVSAAAASLLTFWASSISPWSRPAPPTVRPPEARAVVAAPVAPAPAAAPVPNASAAAKPAPSVAALAPIAPAAEPAVTPPPAAAPKPAARKAKAVAPAAARPTESARSAQRVPSAEPNPYDVKLEDSSTEPVSKPPARGLLDLMQESESKASEAKETETQAATGSNSPGF